jgi:hypothetical protein
LAIERGLDDLEIRAAWSTHPDDVFQFAERHRVSLDWLICGKLAGLLETVRGLPGCGGPDSVLPIIRHAQLCEFDKVLASIDKRKMPMVLAILKAEGAGQGEKETGEDRARRAADAKRAQAYRDMEPHLCDVVKMGTIAVQLFDDPNRELYDFAVCRLSEMLDELRVRYYA